MTARSTRRGVRRRLRRRRRSAARRAPARRAGRRRRDRSGVNEETLTALAEQVAAAGGAITGRYADRVDGVAEQKSLVEHPGQSADDPAGQDHRCRRDDVRRMGQLLASRSPPPHPRATRPAASRSRSSTASLGADLLASRAPSRVERPGAAGARWLTRRRGRRRHHGRHRHGAVCAPRPVSSWRPGRRRWRSDRPTAADPSRPRWPPSTASTPRPAGWPPCWR